MGGVDKIAQSYSGGGYSINDIREALERIISHTATDPD
jgi:hypothetical protein